ncbi:hypothetical protein BpHYR1_033409 [Brachionus plicatilis]|uniref:Uncharacterized protein n=1 Tax=Brachionus plicatilis TaxID=10195 RepID=A0A3M7PJ19_BRAPC|nr:hypothetical protein BpHYR1_033409 [Brachionus plicatilis]
MTLINAVLITNWTVRHINNTFFCFELNFAWFYIELTPFRRKLKIDRSRRLNSVALLKKEKRRFSLLSLKKNSNLN